MQPAPEPVLDCPKSSITNLGVMEVCPTATAAPL